VWSWLIELSCAAKGRYVPPGDINDFGRFDTACREFFEGVLPARTTVQSMLGGVD
jgi:hypothetical protein